MPTILTGNRNTYNINQDQRVIDMAKEIALLEPNAAPLTVLLKQIDGKSRAAISPEFKHLEDELSPRWDQVNDGTGMIAGDTTMVVDNGSYFKVGDVVLIPRTGEQVLVTAVSTNDLTVTRGWGVTAAAAIVDNEPITIVANASAEGVTSPTAKTTKPSTVVNYTEIIRTPFGVTGTEDASELYGGKDMSYLSKKAGIEHKKDIERSFLFGEKKEDTSGSTPRRFTGGLRQWITTNVTDASGALTESELETFCRSIFRYGSKRKTLLASPLVISAINSWAAGKLQTVSSDKTYGIDITQLITGHGRLNIVKHDLLEQSYSGYAFAIDTDNLAYRFLNGRDTKLKTNVQANNSDTREDEYLSEVGLHVMQEKTMGILKGVTSYS